MHCRYVRLIGESESDYQEKDEPDQIGECVDVDAKHGREKRAGRRVTRGSYWESESDTCYQCHHYKC